MSLHKQAWQAQAEVARLVRIEVYLWIAAVAMAYMVFAA